MLSNWLMKFIGIIRQNVLKEFYENSVDSFILVASDSDYWALLSSLPKARYLLMIEREKCSYDLKGLLLQSGIFYCYIDDFYSGDDNNLKLSALVQEIHRYLDRTLNLNVNEMLEAAYRSTRVEMSEDEKKQFYNRFIKPMHLVIGEDGNVTIELQGK